MSKRGRLEARITFSADQSPTWTDSAGSGTPTVAAGSYYWTDLCSTFQTAILNLAGSIGAGATVTPSNGESGATGKTTIDATNDPWSLDWTGATELRDALGFTANISSVTTAQTGANHAKAVWLPDQPKFSPYGDGAGGDIYSDLTTSITPTGRVSTLYGSMHRRHEGIHWTGISKARALAHFESVSGESFESFFRDVALGRLAYVPVGAYVRLIWDADVDGTYAVGRLLWPTQFRLAQLVQGWTGRYNIPLPPLVLEA